ncbi:hypothetical protein [Stenotrophomonas sp. PS02300]|uniref:hypothetical protein n=1 Tax=Stenotrophomonas sp. PS02300 TaxID=2991426 RepID=UPI00249BD16D|nr:hypothetical protein [Stenotrophomonas sp. PS02300]
MNKTKIKQSLGGFLVAGSVAGLRKNRKPAEKLTSSLKKYLVGKGLTVLRNLLS